MNSSTRLVLVAGILLALVSLSFLPAAAQSYTVTDLGTLGGKVSGATAINDSGQVVGTSTVAGYPNYHCFLWSNGSGMQDIGLLNTADNTCNAYGINNVGEVVGMSWGNNGLWGAFLWTLSTGMIDIGSLGGGFTDAYAINNSEQVVGDSTLSDGVTIHAFLWSRSGGMQDLNTLGGSYSTALAVNDGGEVVGASYLSDNVTLHAFLWTPTRGMQDLGTLGGPNSFAVGINASGLVVGNTSNSSQIALGFVWTPSHGMTYLSARQSAFPTAINASDQIVGISQADQLGFIWTRARGLQNLNGLMPHTYGLISEATAINKTGRIVGNSDRRRAMLLTPTK